MVEPPTKQEEMDEEYDRMFQESFGEFGRDATTGY
jgi:hypothetical protein